MTIKNQAGWKLAAGLGTVYVLWGSTYLAMRIAIATLPDDPLLGAAMEMLAGGALFALASVLIGEVGRLHVATVSAASWAAMVFMMKRRPADPG